jgi:hypothetical protein
MTQITDRSFSAVVEDGFDAFGTATPPGGNSGEPFTIITDATAPKTPSNVMRATYEAGYELGAPNHPGPGEAPAHSGKAHTAFAKIYCCVAIKLSSNWVGNGTGVNKFGYEWVVSPAHPNWFFGALGSGATGVLQPCCFFQDMAGADPGFTTPNLTSDVITRGQWFVMEWFIQGNTAGNNDGVVDMYFNGVHCTHITGIGWSTGATTFNVFEIYPIWGGGSAAEPVTSDMFMDWDHLYVSGKN